LRTVSQDKNSARTLKNIAQAVVETQAGIHAPADAKVPLLIRQPMREFASRWVRSAGEFSIPMRTCPGQMIPASKDRIDKLD